MTADAQKLPRLLPGTDLRGLPISPTEAFVVSRIDGTTSVVEIAEETGKPLAEVQALLERLALLGVLSFSEPARGPDRRVSPAPAPRASGGFRLGPIVETRVAAERAHPAASLYDEAELAEAVDIEPARRRQILDLYYRLDQLSHYQVFGIEPSADKKAVKAAYFEVVNVFHPDRYYGKNVGSFKPKLEKVFARLTEAYDVLSRNQSRAEYDNYLHAQSKTRAFDAVQSDAAAHEAALQEVLRRIQTEAGQLERTPSLAPAPAEPAPTSTRAPQANVVSSLPPASLNPGLRPSASLRPSDPESRRRALARKLGGRPVAGGDAGGAAEPPTSSPEADAQKKAWAADELKRRYQERVRSVRDRQIEGYVQSAKQCLDRGDHVGAANALRMASSLAPENRGLAEQLNEVSARAKQELSQSYLEQAEYEERDGKWLAAAKSYARAVAGRPEAKLYDHLASCLLTGDGDLREAGQAAQKAVLMEPNDARLRITLARFYVKAGMKQSAEGELSRAATLAPSDDKVTDWIRKLKRELG